MPITLNINGTPRDFDVDPNTPLLWVMREDLGLTGTKYGCGIAQCGACTVHVDGQPLRSCSAPVSAVAGRKVTTIEGLSSRAAKAVQKAWVDLDVVQCGYCQSGQIMSATALLEKKPKPSDTDIDRAMAGNICRCATYQRIRAAIHAASQQLAAEEATMHPLMRSLRPRRATPGSWTARPLRRIHRALGSSPRVPARRRPAGLVLGFGWVGPTAPQAALPGAEGAATGPLAPNAFVRVGTDNLVTVICKHHEMGQGNTTGLAIAGGRRARCRLVAGAHRVRAVGCEALQQSRCSAMQGTGGSSAIANSFLQYRSAGATARAMLVAAAAEAWKVPASEITDREERAHARLGPARDASARWPMPQAGRRRRDIRR